MLRSRRLSTIASLCGSAILILSFQNCSEFDLDRDFVYNENIFASSEALDAENLPKLLNSTNLAFWRKPGATDFYKSTPFFSEGGSLVATLDRNVQGSVASLITMSTQTEQMSIEVGDGKVRAVRYTSPGNYLYLESNVPSLGDKYIVAARFGVASDDAALMINGVVQSAAIQKVGTPVDTFYVQRFASVAGTGGSASEVVMYTENLKNTDLNVMSRYLARSQNIPNVIYDPSLNNSGNGSGGSTAPSAEFIAAKAIIDSRCVSCHNTSSMGNLSNLTESKAVAMGWVVPGKATESKVYYRLIGSMGSGNKNMPSGGNPLSAAEVKAMEIWINSIK